MIWHNFCVVIAGRNGAPNLSESTAGSAHNDVRKCVPHTGQTAGSLFDGREHHGFNLNHSKRSSRCATLAQPIPGEYARVRCRFARCPTRRSAS